MLHTHNVYKNITKQIETQHEEGRNRREIEMMTVYCMTTNVLNGKAFDGVFSTNSIAGMVCIILVVACCALILFGIKTIWLKQTNIYLHRPLQHGDFSFIVIVHTACFFLDKLILLCDQVEPMHVEDYIFYAHFDTVTNRRKPLG